MNSERQFGIGDRCYKFSVRVIKFVNKLPEKRASRILADQLLRSAMSIGANLIEGKGASSRKDFLNFHHIALKSANETAYWLALLKDGLDISDPELELLRNETVELTKILGASVVTLKTNQKF